MKTILKILTILLTLIIWSNTTLAAHKHLEREYQAAWCTSHNGVMEYKLPDKARVDCLTKDYAVEFDFAPKWAECIGQALYYGKKTKRAPVCVLIMENPVKDGIHLYRLRYAVYKKRKKQPSFQFRTFTMKPDDIE